MLEDDKFRLRALETSDIDVLFLWENNPKNWKVSHTVAPFSRQVLAAYIDAVNDIYSDKQLRLVIESKEAQEAVGAVDLFDCDFKNRRTGIGILIADAENRGKGLGRRVLSLMMDYCFDTLGFHQVYCNILADNEKSLNLFEKFGFERAGLKKDWVLYNGDFFDEWTLQKINRQEIDGK